MKNISTSFLLGKRRIGLHFALGLFLFFAVSFNAVSQKKRALIVAIGEYAPETQWGKISSANDTPLLTEALTRQGFDEINVLSDADATKEGLEKQFEALLEKTQKGDVILIHFSSHGQQIEDLSGDEVDGLDEAIICYDSPKKFTAGYMGTRHLVDDELGDWIKKFRMKAGKNGDVLLLADACHSGSVARNLGTRIVRGGAPALSLTGKELKPASTKEVFLTDSNDRDLSNSENLAPFAVISAASAEQINYEYIDKNQKSYGSLSYAFNRVINNATSNETYRSLFAKIQSEMKVMASSQTPEIEGLLDRKIWAGAAIDSEPYYSVTNLKNGRIEINGGEVHGISVGSKIELYPLGNYISEEEKPAYRGVVQQANTFNAIVQLDEALDTKKYWAYASEKVFGDVFTNVSFHNVDRIEQLKGILKESQIIRFDNVTPPELAIEKVGVNRVQIENIGTLAPLGGPINISNGEGLKEVKTRLENYTKSKFLLGFNPKSPGLEAKLEIIPASSYRIGDTLSINNFVQNGLISIDTSHFIFLKVINNSDFRIYYNIVDIDAENWISVIVPDTEDNDGKDYWVEPNSEKIVGKNRHEKDFELFEPFGSETLKLFVSDEPMDLRSISTRNLSLNPLSSLEKVFDFSEKMATRSAEVSYSNKFKATSYTLNFQIAPSK